MLLPIYLKLSCCSLVVFASSRTSGGATSHVVTGVGLQSSDDNLIAYQCRILDDNPVKG